MSRTPEELGLKNGEVVRIQIKNDRDLFVVALADGGYGILFSRPMKKGEEVVDNETRYIGKDKKVKTKFSVTSHAAKALIIGLSAAIQNNEKQDSKNRVSGRG